MNALEIISLCASLSLRNALGHLRVHGHPAWLTKCTIFCGCFQSSSLEEQVRHACSVTVSGGVVNDQGSTPHMLRETSDHFLFLRATLPRLLAFP